MTETERAEWNAAVAAVNADPSDMSAVARRDALRERLLAGVHAKLMTDDAYQARTH
jgi:hypothetical protein